MHEEEKLSHVFDEALNKEQLLSYLETRKEQQLKFTNPIRDYKHLLANRIVHSMIELRDLIKNTSYKALQTAA